MVSVDSATFHVGNSAGPVKAGRGGGRLAQWVAAAGPAHQAVVRGSLLALLVTAGAQLLALGLQILVARLLGPVEFGLYSYVAAALAIGLIVAKLGLDTALVRLVAEFIAAGEPGSARAAIGFARTTGVAVGGVVAGIGFLGAGVLPSDPSLAAPALVAAVLLPVAVASELTGAALRGLRRLTAALSGDGLVRPLVAMAVIVAGGGSWLDYTARSAFIAYLIGTVASLAVTSWLLRTNLPADSRGGAAPRPRNILGISIPLMMASGILVAIYSVDTLMLGALADTTTAGYYAVSSRIALFVLFVMNAAQTVVSPMIAAARVSANAGQLRALVRTLNGLSLLAAVPTTIVFMFGAELFLSVFGSEFQAAAPALRILVLSQFLNVVTGPTGTVLSMTGHGRTLAFLLGLGLVVNVALNIVWIPEYGLTGAAYASLVAQLVWNSAAVVVIRRNLGIDVTTVDLLRRLPAVQRQ